MKSSFENIHRNKKWAFLDGMLTGLVFAGIAWYFRKEVQEIDHQVELRTLEEKTHKSSFNAGWDSAKKRYTRPYTEEQKRLMLGTSEQ